MTTNPTPDRYRKRPAEIEAVQLLGSEDGEPAREIARWCGGWLGSTFREPKLVIPTLEGGMTARVGDWVVRGVKGEFYPVRADIFAETYEPASSVVVSPPPATNQATVLREAADRLAAMDPVEAALAGQHAWQEAAKELRRMAAEASTVETCLNCRGSGLDPRYNGEYDCPDCPAGADEQAVDPSRMADEAQQQLDTERPRCPLCQMPHDLTPGSMGARACESIRARIAEAARRHAGGDHGGCAAVDCETVRARRAEQLAVVAAVAGETPDTETQTLAAMFEGLHTLLATSSRDWGTYRVDAWLWAVLCGWDCEQDEHDETCTHGAMEEMQQRHGWSDEAVAKARRYRAAVRAIENRAAVFQPGKEA